MNTIGLNSTRRCVTPQSKTICPSLLRSVAVLSCLLLSGCGNSGPERAAVEGAISLDGKPLPAGIVTFVPVGDPKKPLGPSAVAKVKDGAFKLSAYEGAVVGPNKIMIEATDYMGFAVDDEQAFAKNAVEKGASPRQPVPEIYNVKSTLKEEVKSGVSNKYDFKLTGAVK